MDDIGLLRALHVTGAVLLLGNVTVTGVWAALLYRVRQRVPFRAAARAILWTDLVFTLGGGALLTVSGILLVLHRGYSLGEQGWLRQGIGALVLATVLWVLVLVPAQFRLERLDPSDYAGLRRVFLRWSVVGWVATLVLFYGLWVMVKK